MDPIGITQPLIVSVPAPAPAPVTQSAPLVTLPPEKAPDQVPYNAQAAEQTRATTVQHLAQQIANDYVLGDQTFSIFKDSTGQYITRFTSLRDGKVTYIPEPTLFKLGSSSGADTKPLLKIKA